MEAVFDKEANGTWPAGSEGGARRSMEAFLKFIVRAGSRAVPRIPKATLYKSGMFGMSVTEVHDLAIDIGPYAQYRKALYVSFRMPRARKISRVVYSAGSSGPGVVVLEGWKHPNLVADPMSAPVVCDGVITSRSRHSACSPEYEIEFRAALEAYLAKAPKVKAHNFLDHRDY